MADALLVRLRLNQTIVPWQLHSRLSLNQAMSQMFSTYREEGR